MRYFKVITKNWTSLYETNPQNYCLGEWTKTAWTYPMFIYSQDCILGEMTRRDRIVVEVEVEKVKTVRDIGFFINIHYNRGLEYLRGFWKEAYKKPLVDRKFYVTNKVKPIRVIDQSELDYSPRKGWTVKESLKI